MPDAKDFHGVAGDRDEDAIDVRSTTTATSPRGRARPLGDVAAFNASE
jgi:hypothetical protein